MKACTIRVIGKVQGVFFRASAKDIADQLGICGIVRNEPDGSVCVEAEGDESALARFVEWCKKGPPNARVVTFIMEGANPRYYVGFKIDRP
jgi:acylphosphatase